MRRLQILINTVAGTLLVTNTFVQQGIGLSSFETGLLSVTYLIAVLAMIRVGEKILQEFGPRNLCLLVQCRLRLESFNVDHILSCSTVYRFMYIRLFAVWIRFRIICDAIY